MIRPIRRIDLPKNRRIIAVSDIHGNLPYFQGLLDKIEFSSRDILVIDGDFLEKGEDSLALLRFIMELEKRGNVYTIRGNCDGWHEFIDQNGKMDEFARNYMLPRKYSLLRQMCREYELEVTNDSDMNEVRGLLSEHFAAELEFLRMLPVIIETENYTFVHGGVSGASIDEVNPYTCMKNDNFLGQGYSFDKWMIVGHWPVVLYHEDKTDANPIILRDRKIISIDGGCVLKDDGQLNALIIPYDGSEDFQCVYYDHFPLVIAEDRQAASENSYYIRWGDNCVQILEQGEEFSLCRHLRTGVEMEILTKYLSFGVEGCIANDCTNYELEVSPGDRLSVVERTSKGILCKKNGISGWYRGRMK